jgi:hypothetical protein
VDGQGAALPVPGHGLGGDIGRLLPCPVRGSATVLRLVPGPGSAGALPATPRAVADFVVDQAEIKAKSTVHRYLASIAKAHKTADLVNPVADEDVMLTFERLYRDDPSEPNQSEGLRWETLSNGLTNLGESTRAVRDNALQRVAKAAGLDPRGFSGHACRIGACQDLLAAGIDIGRVMLAGDWERPEMPDYYGRNLTPDQSGVAELSQKQRRDYHP